MAETARVWSRVRVTYGMEIALGADVLLPPAVTVAAGVMASPEQ
jgi:hypothetical protein